MSLKSIELQIALPKTFDAGKQANQVQQQIHAGQDMANEALKKQLEKNNTLLLESAELHQLKKEDPREQAKQEQKKQKEQQERAAKAKTKHPFKGNYFDFSG